MRLLEWLRPDFLTLCLGLSWLGSARLRGRVVRKADHLVIDQDFPCCLHRVDDRQVEIGIGHLRLGEVSDIEIGVTCDTGENYAVVARLRAGAFPFVADVGGYRRLRIAAADAEQPQRAWLVPRVSQDGAGTEWWIVAHNVSIRFRPALMTSGL